MIKNKDDDYLSHAAFLLHVLSNNRPDLAFAQQSPTGGNFKALIGPILLQDSMNDPNCLSHTHKQNVGQNILSALKHIFHSTKTPRCNKTQLKKSLIKDSSNCKVSRACEVRHFCDT